MVRPTHEQVAQTPFERTRMELEQRWATPYAAWTRSQHLEHTKLIYHVLGWGDAAITQPIGVDTDSVSRSRYPDAMRREAIAMVQRGMSRREVAKRFGLGHTCVDKWVDTHARQQRKIAAAQRQAGAA